MFMVNESGRYMEAFLYIWCWPRCQKWWPVKMQLLLLL